MFVRVEHCAYGNNSGTVLINTRAIACIEPSTPDDSLMCVGLFSGDSFDLDEKNYQRLTEAIETEEMK